MHYFIPVFPSHYAEQECDAIGGCLEIGLPGNGMERDVIDGTEV